MTRSRMARLGLLGAASAAVASFAAAALPVTVASAQATPAPAVFILLDCNNSLSGPELAAEESAATAYAAALPAQVRVGLISFSDQWRMALPLTGSRGRLAAALTATQLGGPTSTGLHAAISAAASALDRPGVAARGRVLVLSNGEVLRRSAAAGIPTDVVTWRYESDDHVAALRALASASGGRLSDPAHVAALAAVFAAEVGAGSAQASAPSAAPARTASPAGGPASLIALIAIVFPVLVALALLALRSLAPADRSRRLPDELARYGPRHAPAQPDSEGAMARVAVGWAARLLRSSNSEPGLARRLDLAGIARRPAEWVLLGVSASAALAAALTALSGNAVIGVLVGALAGWLGMRLVVSLRIGRRRAAFSGQLPEVLQLIASSLQAGFSLPQSLDAVVREGSTPISSEFSRALGEARIGVDLTEALDEVAARMDSADLSWTVMAIRIQREVGGNLAEVLRTTVDTMRERAYLRRQVRSLSAEGRLSAYILVALPIVVGSWLFLTSRSYMRPLYTTGFGLLMLAGAVVMVVLGALWMRRLIKVEV